MKKVKQMIKQAILVLIVNSLIFAWLWYGLATATTLR